MKQVVILLLTNLTNKYLDIDALVTKFSIPATKLKNDFKNIFGVSIFSYFQSKHLKLAYEYLQNENYIINEIVAHQNMIVQVNLKQYSKKNTIFFFNRTNKIQFL